MIPGAVPQSLNSLTDLEKIKEQSQWVDVSINTELSTAGQKSGPRRPPRRVKRRHTWEWMWAEWSVWGEAQPRSGEPCSDRLTRGPTEAHPEREREREREFLTCDRTTHQVELSILFPALSLFHWLSGNYCQRLRRKWAEKKNRNQVPSPSSQCDTLPVQALGRQKFRLSINIKVLITALD